nr:alpha/beta fold hydrolase [Allomuricauda sp.]
MNIKILQNLFVRHNAIDSHKPSIWFIHGFGDSGLAYKEVFGSVLDRHFNLYVVDMPGFGASPLLSDCTSIDQQADLLSKVILLETGDAQQVNIVSHSLGSLVGTWLCQKLKGRVHWYFNVEGNLTVGDSYFSSKPLEFDTAQEFAKSFYQEIFEKAKLEERYKRYYCSVRLANPEGMRQWAKSSQEHVRENQCGFEFINLDCNKIYMWGDVDTPLETQKFITEHKIPNKLYEGVGHWHMIENTYQLYQDIYEMTCNA